MISFSATETPHWRESKVWTEEICLPRSYRIMNKLKHFITKGDNCTHTNTHTQTLKKNPRILHKHPNFFYEKKEVFFNKLKCNLQYICVRINVESGALLFLCFIEILTGKKKWKIHPKYLGNTRGHIRKLWKFLNGCYGIVNEAGCISIKLAFHKA